MNKQFIILLTSMLVGFCSLGQTEGYRQNENDLYFKFFIKNKGKTAKIGDLASLHMIIKAENGDVLKNSYTESQGKPILFPVKIPTFAGDIYEAVSMMAAGDSASFLISSDSIYHNVFRKPLPNNVQSGSLLNFNLKVQWIKAQSELEIKEHEVDVDRVQLEKEEAEIKSYIKSHGLAMKRTKSGVYVEETKKGQGEAAVATKMISINYTGKFLDDKVFESTFEEEKFGRPISVTIGNQQVIRGWEEAFLEMKAGGTYMVLIPSHMAFGIKGKGNVIPPNTPLAFEIKVLSVR